MEMNFGSGSTWKVGLEVTNSAGKTDRTTVEITPQSRPDPTAVINVDPDEKTPWVTLDASESTTPIGKITSYERVIQKLDDDFNIIDEIQRSGEVVEKPLEAGTIYSIELQVENSEGLTDRGYETVELEG